MSSIISVNHCKNESGHANFSVPENCRLDAADFQSFNFSYLRLHRQESIRTSALPGIGDVIAGRFRLQKLIGDGGIGVVFKARDILQRKGECVAIKFYCPKNAAGSYPQNNGGVESEEIQAKLFRHGTKNSRLLTCGYTPAVLACGAHGEIPFVVTELIKGEDLKTVLEKNPGGLPYQTVLKLAIQICYALQELHINGMVHRDLKPANIMLKDDGQLVLLDFDCLWSADMEKVQSRGQVAGTCAYLRPEELLGAKCSARGDLYSFGCILYELLTGAKLHPQSEKAEIIASHLSGKTPGHIPHIPKSFCKIIAKAVSKDPEKRYGSAAVMRLALEKVQRAQTQGFFQRSLSFISSYLSDLSRSAL